MRGHRLPVLGILGGGQLGRMTALAAIPMGIRVRFLVPEPAWPVDGLGDVMVADWTDPAVLERFAAGCDAVTVESEWAPAELLEPILPAGTALWPSARTVLVIRNKIDQKKKLAEAGVPVPDFRACGDLPAAVTCARELGLPVVLKRPIGSYDGYGNFTALSLDDVATGWNRLAGEDGLLVEARVDFRRELTVLVARAPSGACVTYPVAYTEQRDYRCHAVVVPSGVPEDTERRAREVALDAVLAVSGVGITAVELFETRSGDILVNELAPRPHNTGHYSIEACHTSQFENHVRAVMGLPLGDPSARVGAACMVNVLGSRSGAAHLEGFADALMVDRVAVHLYGKHDVRPARKMGHVTATGADPTETRARAERAAALITL